MTENGANLKRKKYNIITFSLLAFFFLFGFLSKHLKEPVKPAAKTHHISHTLSSKSSSSHKKEKTKSSTTTSKEDEKKMLKTKIKIKHPLLFKHQIKNKTTKHPTKMEIKKSPSLLKVDEVGRTRRWLLCHKRRRRWRSRCSLRRRCWWRKQSRKINRSEQ